MRKTDMQIDEKRAHGIGEAKRIGIQDMRGIGRKGNETSW